MSRLRFCDILVIISNDMARKLRVEVEGGLCHLIARGNDRQDSFHSHEDRQRFLALLLKEKVRSTFFLYAYCLMTNHIHLLLERQAETIRSLRFAREKLQTDRKLADARDLTDSNAAPIILADLLDRLLHTK